MDPQRVTNPVSAALTETPGGPPVKAERTWGMIAHLSSLAGYLFPLGNVFGPLVVWLARRDRSVFVGNEARESLNFQLSLTLYALVSLVLTLLLIGVIFLLAIPVLHIILVIIAAVRVNDGIPYRYPLTIRFIR